MALVDGPHTPAAVLKRLGRLQFQGASLEEQVWCPTTAKRLAGMRQRTPQCLQAKAYAKAWLAINALNGEVVGSQNEVSPSPSPGASTPPSWTKTLLAPGRGQIIPVAQATPVAEEVVVPRFPMWQYLMSVIHKLPGWLDKAVSMFLIYASGMLVIAPGTALAAGISMLQWVPSYVGYVITDVSRVWAGASFSTCPPPPSCTCDWLQASNVSHNITVIEANSIPWWTTAGAGFFGASLASLLHRG